MDNGIAGEQEKEPMSTNPTTNEIYWPKGGLIDRNRYAGRACWINGDVHPALSLKVGLSVVLMTARLHGRAIIWLFRGLLGKNPLYLPTSGLTERWRLTHSEKQELHDITADPSHKVPQRSIRKW